MIPYVLHQTWKSATLPEPMAGWHRSWSQQNPGLDLRFYDDDACREFVAREHPDRLGLYESLRFPVERADLFRYLVILTCGGVYADVDVECCRPMREFFDMSGAIFCVAARITPTRQREFGFAQPYLIGNCVFAAEPGHAFIEAIVARVAKLAAENPVHPVEAIEDITGPRMVSRLFYERRFEGLQIVDQTFWMPSNTYPRCFPFTRYVYTRHHFMGSWSPPRPGDWRRRWIERDILPNPFPRRLFRSFF